ncbi:MAG: hypothetical protein A2133_03380 [Actinobacteria bacterium RBG_16_64_13]|nr:MAG: hypothetical protein A2133_03380 [Actinobacteria bacterium RBG_16_64_13]
MDEVTSFLRVVHIVAAMTMAWPYYALAAVNQRIALGPPLGDRTDRYLENILKNRTIACFVFQGTLLIGGFLLIWARVSDSPLTVGDYLGDWAILAKIIILLIMAGMLSWVHFLVQPEIDRLFGDYGVLADDAKKRITTLRMRRKKMASLCMFLAFSAAILGVESVVGFPAWLTAVLLAVAALWVWRSYTSKTRYGWV